MKQEDIQYVGCAVGGPFHGKILTSSDGPFLRMAYPFALSIADLSLPVDATEPMKIATYKWDYATLRFIFEADEA